MKGREELFSFKIPAPSGPGAKIGRPRPSTTATPRKLPLHSHSAFKPFAHYSDRLLAKAVTGSAADCALVRVESTKAQSMANTIRIGTFSEEAIDFMWSMVMLGTQVCRWNRL